MNLNGQKKQNNVRPDRNNREEGDLEVTEVRVDGPAGGNAGDAGGETGGHTNS